MDTKLFHFFRKIYPLVCFEEVPQRVTAFTKHYGQFKIFKIQEKKLANILESQEKNMEKYEKRGFLFSDFKEEKSNLTCCHRYELEKM